MKKYLIHLVFLLCLNHVSWAQQNILDTTNLIFTAKLRCLESGIYSIHDIDFLQSRMHGRILKSTGFNSNFVIFILIEKRKTELDTVINQNIIPSSSRTISDYKANLVLGDCDYILAYNFTDNLFYRLKGFLENDFDRLIKSLIKVDYKVEMYFKKKGQFIRNFYIEDIDLNCLFTLNKTKTKVSGCDFSCYERDKRAFIFR